jgi:hypothetical protein
VNVRQRRQFIQQGAISLVGIAVVFVDLFDVMTRSGGSYVRIYYLSSTTKISGGAFRALRWIGWLVIVIPIPDTPVS